MFRIRMADLVIEIRAKYPYLRGYCREYRYRGKDRTDFSVSVLFDEIREESQKSGMGKGYSEGICVYRRIGMNLLDYGGMIIHGVAVEKDGKAYLFLSKSGGGKSTHAALWEKLPGGARILNGDKPIIRKIDGVWKVFGTPWQGKEDQGYNGSAPLHGACFLEKSDKNQICFVERNQVVDRLLKQMQIPHEENKYIIFLTLLEDLISTTSFFLLKCRKDMKAAELAYENMRDEKYEEGL